mgnify:CR=1 FL=1
MAGSNGFNGIPVYYDYQNMYDSQFRPYGMRARNTGLSLFFDRYLFQKLFSVYEFTIPDTWDPDYFRYTLFVMGYTIVFETDRFGIVNNHGSLYGRNFYYRPTNAIVANPLLRSGARDMQIGVNCQLIKLTPDYRGAYDVVSTFSDIMSLIIESMGVNLFNTKLAYVFAAENKAAAESFKAMFSDIASGQPAAVIDRKLFNEDGEPAWYMFNQNLKNTFLGNDFSTFMSSIESMFLSFIGINNVNYEKRERLTNDEVNANNQNTQAVARVWLDSMQSSMKKVNEMYGLNLSVRLRDQYEFNDQEVEE